MGVSGAIVAAVIGAGASAYSSKQTAKAQKRSDVMQFTENRRQEQIQAKQEKLQAEQAKMLAEREAKAKREMDERRARAEKGRSDLLYGSETGVSGKQTLLGG